MSNHHLPGLEPGKEKLENKGKLRFKTPSQMSCSFQPPLGCLERSFSKPAHGKLLLTSSEVLCYHLAPHVLPKTLQLQDIPGIFHPFHPSCECTPRSTPILQWAGGRNHKTCREFLKKYLISEGKRGRKKKNPRSGSPPRTNKQPILTASGTKQSKMVFSFPFSFPP